MNSPLSEIWFQRKDKCQQCANLRTHEGRSGNIVMRCSAVAWANTGQARVMRRRGMRHRPEPKFNAMPYCIDARETGKPCGPSAALFMENVE